MRGGASPPGRGWPSQQPRNEALTVPHTHPAPYGGWNARGNLANMKPDEALLMDNLFPGILRVELRKGCIDWATAAPDPITALLPYQGLTANKLFAATDTDIYDVTTSGAIGAAVVSTLGSGNWKSVMMATSGGNFLLAANGVDSMRSYDGAAWATPAVTVATSSTWNYLTVHKRRLWAIQKDTLDLWYLPVDSIAGAAVKFPVGPLFKKGGKLVAIGTWTLDSGSGIDDLFVIVTSNGEIAVYQGTDPASSSTWALVAVYEVAKPIGDRPLLDYGGDLLYLGATGLLPLSRLRQSTIIDTTSNISLNIDGAFIDVTAEYGGNHGWQMLTHKSANLLLVNIPIAEEESYYQFAMNTATKKWCRFTGWNATCWTELGGDIFFGSATGVSQAWIGTSDAGVPITGTVLQSYAKMGSNSQKKIELVRPNFGFTGAAQLIMALNADYKLFEGATQFSYTPTDAGSLWDLANWDEGIWDAGVSLFEPKWTTVPGDLGFVHSLSLQVIASSGNFTWTSTDLALKGAGIL